MPGLSGLPGQKGEVGTHGTDGAPGVPGLPGTKGNNGQSGSNAVGGGAVYIRWGRKSCGSNSNRMYEGKTHRAFQIIMFIG